MMEFLRPLFNWTEAVVAGVVLYLMGPLVRRIVNALRMSRAWKERLLKLLPTLQIVAWFAYGVWLVGLFVANQSPVNLIPVATVSAALVIASWFAVRDIVSGAILRTEDIYQPGEWLRVGDTAGRIRNVGARSIELELENGRRLRVPYSQFTAAAITKAEPVGAATAHSFSVSLPRTISVAAAKSKIKRAALLSAWSSTTRTPRIETDSPSADEVRLNVTVYAIHPDYDLEIENAVRTALESHQEART